MAATVPSVVLNTGYNMPRLGLGTFNMFKKGEVRGAVEAAIRGGYRLVDTAWIYRCEAEIGDALQEVISCGIVKREDLFITTKLWNIFHEVDAVETGVTESLSDLHTDYVDLLLMHWPIGIQMPENKTVWLDNPAQHKLADVSFTDTWKAMERLVDKGLVRSIGVSNFNVSQLKRLLAADLKYKPANVQIEMHPYMINTELLNFCKERDIAVTGYSPLAKGGSQYVGKTTPPRLLEEEVMTSIAQKHKKSPAQVALRWGLQRGYSIVPKSITPSRILENMQVFDFELSDEEMDTICSLNKDFRLVKLHGFDSFPEYPFN